jgi:hypothetical protein
MSYVLYQLVVNPFMLTVFQAKSGKELVGFLMNDFLLLAQPFKPLGSSFSFEKYASTTFKLYKKVRLKLKVVTYETVMYCLESPDINGY